MEVLKELYNKRISIRDVYKQGIGQSFILLRYTLPILFCIIFIFLINNLSISTENFLDLIKQLNGLVGIVLGFSITSFAIFISISNENLELKSKWSKYTYREIGSSLFFYNVEVSLFISLIGILLIYMNIPMNYILNIANMYDSINIISYLEGIKICIFLIYILMFFQLIFNLFYSSIFLNSSIKK